MMKKQCEENGMFCLYACMKERLKRMTHITKNKASWRLCAAALSLLLLAGCGAQQTAAPAAAPAETPAAAPAAPAPETKTAEAQEKPSIPGALENEGLYLRIPEGYADLLVTKVPEHDESGVLFSASEKASIEAGEKVHPGEDWGDGWLFDIRRTDEETMHEALKFDMSGQRLFAKDADGYYYFLDTPTDVRLMREEGHYDPESEDMKQWSELCEWAASVPAVFLSDNPGLEEMSAGNSDADMYFAQIAWGSEDDEFGPEFTMTLRSGGKDAEPLDDHAVRSAQNGTLYAKDLVLDYIFEHLEDAPEYPEGDSVLLSSDWSASLRFFEGSDLVAVEYDGGYYMLEANHDAALDSVGDVLMSWYAEAALV